MKVSTKGIISTRFWYRTLSTVPSILPLLTGIGLAREEDEEEDEEEVAVVVVDEEGASSTHDKEPLLPFNSSTFQFLP